MGRCTADGERDYSHGSSVSFLEEERPTVSERKPVKWKKKKNREGIFGYNSMSSSSRYLKFDS